MIAPFIQGTPEFISANSISAMILVVGTLNVKEVVSLVD
jgi:hypothetical protein